MNTKRKTPALFTAVALDAAARRLAQGLRRARTRRGFGLNEVIGIAAGVIVAALVVIPGLQTFAADVIDRLGVWWGGMADTLFTP